MDSGTSGSMQSSSGGDEEQDSQANTSIPPFWNNNNNNPSSNFGPQFSNPPNYYLFTPQLNSLDAFSQTNLNPNSFSSLDPVWSRSALPSVPNSTTTLPNLTGSSPITHNKSILGAQSTNNSFPSSSSAMLRSDHDNVAPGPDEPNVVRNTKKRTRASRRAPTTVMVTDTANFRTMVQEFTGIPAPPFSASPYSGSRRLDLFGTAGGSTMRSGHLETLGSFYHPLKPSAHRVNTNPFVSSSSPNNNLWDPNLNKYQLPSDTPKMLQNPNLSFEALLQTPNFSSSLGYTSGEVPVFGTNKSQVSSTNNVASLNQDLGMGQNIGHQLNVNADLGVSGDGKQQLRSEDNVTNWRDSENNHQLRPKKSLDNVSSRGGEGTVDSWISPSS